MELFMSDKEEMFELLQHYSGLETLQCGFETSQRPIFQTSLKIKSLEQHDRELLEELECWIMEQPTNDEYGYENTYFDDYISVGELLEKIEELKERGVK